jgi:rSAM/selenodomain-associated transferase 1
MKYADTVILIFAKAPVAGQVNTRLIPAIGIERATQLQQQWIIERVSALASCQLAHLSLFCSPDELHETFQYCKRSYGISLYPQAGSCLGEKMYVGVQWALQHYACCIVIGTDAPALTSGQIEEAITALHQGYDCVYKPAEDGGYVLAGYRNIRSELFENIDWGCNNVMSQVEKRLVKSNINYQLLSRGWDIDRPEDYQRYQELCVQSD